MFLTHSFKKRTFQFGAVSLLLLSGPVAKAATFTVTNTNNDGAGSLRQAIIEANAASGADTINFNISGEGVQTIAPASELPLIFDVVNLDARTQPGYAGTPLIQLDGAGAGRGASGLCISAPFSSLESAPETAVRGLAIGNFDGSGVAVVPGGGVTLEANFLGVDANGTVARPNGNGVTVFGGNANSGKGFDNPGSAALIGGLRPEQRNLISGNRRDGVLVVHARVSVQSNFIGTTASGAAALGNGRHGIVIDGDTSQARIGTFIDGFSPLTRPIIAGNGGSGIVLAGGRFHQVTSCFIGTDASGTSAIPNSEHGVEVRNSTTSGFSGDERGSLFLNVIAGNGLNGVLLLSGGYRLDGNIIGLAADRATPLGNKANGIQIVGASAAGNSIGLVYDSFNRAFFGRGNVVSGNRVHGVLVQNSTASIIGNRIGVDATGTRAAGNGGDGVRLEEARAGIGAPADFRSASGLGNVISGNGGNGLTFLRSGGTVFAGRIGTDLNGQSAIPNNHHGIELIGARDLTLGGFSRTGGQTSDSSNLISGNLGDGLRIAAVVMQGQNPSGVRVVANRIGTARDGAGALGNGGSGISLQMSSTVEIGRENTIAFNRGQGVRIDGGEGNSVRARAIFQNGGDGVSVSSGRGHSIICDSIYDNGGLGIDLGRDGVNPNDAGDSDVGANDGQNFPILSGAFSDANGVTSVQGTLNSTPNASFLIHIYAGEKPDPSGFGEGRRLLGSLPVVTDERGQATFSRRFESFVARGQFLSAIATNEASGTSEFSAAARVGADDQVPQVTFSNPQDGEALRVFKGISGMAQDNGTVARVELQIRRRADGKYFNGSAFDRAPVLLPTELIGPNWRYTRVLPPLDQLLEGQYTLLAIATDGSGNRGRTTIDVLVDRSGPQVSFVAPRNGETISAFTAIAGRAVEDIGSGLARVDLVLQRRSDRKYFDGTTFVTASTRLPVVLSGNNFRYNGAVPTSDQLMDGQYTLTAVAYDRLGNRGDATITVTVRKTTTSAVQNTLEPSSPLALSSATADAARQAIVLRFTGALNGESAATDSYQVQVNGANVALESATYDQSTFRVTLQLSNGVIMAGDEVIVSWRRLRDAKGRLLPGQSGPLAAR